MNAVSMRMPQNIGRLAGPVLVLLILAMMVLPLPPLALDILFTLNIALAVVVLLVSLNTSRPLDFSVFPTVLLITTLLRLSLNVASTRVVLLQGHTGPEAAGQVIASFGNFLVGGNYAVGLVVFIILVIINFVVITRGAGRIAEVAARFTLDAMPGKQLAIDADLSAGFIDEQQARARRSDLGRETDFYGAMDGASKFVRGDAIAGVLILFINLLGGMAIGILQQGMAPAEAAARYALLTVGDGLVAQIPALIISTAAGIMVSRASGDQDLGSAFLGQVFGRPQVLYVTAALLGVLGLIPGTPHFAFLTLAMVMAAAAYSVSRRHQMAETTLAELSDAPPDGSEVSWDDIPPVDVLGLEVGMRLIPLLDRHQGGTLLNHIREARRAYAQDLGMVLPPVRVRDNLDLRANGYRITLKGVEVARGDLYADRMLAVEGSDLLGRVDGRVTTDPASGLPAVWITAENAEAAQLRGYQVYDPERVLRRHLDAVFRLYGAELLGRAETRQFLDSVERDNPGLVEEVAPRWLTLTALQGILQALVAENVSLRDARTLLEALAARAPQTQNQDDLVETLRAALGRSLVDRAFEGADELRVMSLDPVQEGELLRVLEQDGEALLPPALLDNLSRGVEQAAHQQVAAGHPLVLLVGPGLRAMLSRLLRRVQPGLMVLSYAEIPLDKQVRVTTEIRVEAWSA
jgi:flagellar biosynthesis protein FlhA